MLIEAKEAPLYTEVINGERETLVNGDCEACIQYVEDASINLVVTSPPYNVDLGNNKYNKNPYDLYNDNKDHREYIAWLTSIFGKIKPKLVEGGRVCINIGDGKNGAIPTSSDIIQFMSNDLGYINLAHIIWDKHSMASRTAWGSFMSPSCPSYPCGFEHILVFGNNDKKLHTKGDTDLTKEEFILYANSYWSFAPETKAEKIGHPAPFPVELPSRCIKMNTFIGETVLDPFMGSGTTGIASRKLGRKFIGFELSEDYFKIACDRILTSPYKLY